MNNSQLDLYKQLMIALGQAADEVMNKSELTEREKGSALLTATSVFKAQLAKGYGVEPDVAIRCFVSAVADVYDLNMAFISNEEAAAMDEAQGEKLH